MSTLLGTVTVRMAGSEVFADDEVADALCANIEVTYAVGDKQVS